MRPHPITPGERYGRLTTVSVDPATMAAGRRQWICRCDCGQTASVLPHALVSGNTSSCGCLRIERLRAAVVTHGLSHKIPEYGQWRRMIQRCTDPNVPEYARYGGRGITVCTEWLDFGQFLSDMGRRPDQKATLERLDNDRGYEPGNVRWATRKEQARNTATNHRLTFNDETLSMAEWSERTGVPYYRLRSRLRYGWTVERALTEPVRGHSGKS